MLYVDVGVDFASDAQGDNSDMVVSSSKVRRAVRIREE